MVAIKRFKTFDDELLDRHPDLKQALKPNDIYPELKYIIKNRSANVPIGSMNTKIIINDGEIVQRVYKTPKGKVISLFSQSSNMTFDQAA